jgi:hypothetical protein
MRPYNSIAPAPRDGPAGRPLYCPGMPPLRRHWSSARLRRRWLLALGTAALTAAPLVGTLGYEGSLVLTTPLTILGVLTGLDVVRRLRAELATYASPPGPERALAGFPLADLLRAGLAELAALLGLCAGILAVAQLWQPTCDPWTGLAFFALGPGVSGLLGLIAGLHGGLLATRPRRQRLIAAAPLGFCLALGLWRLYADPVVYALDPFFGYIAGPIYDEAIPLGGRYLWFRVYNLVAALAAVLALRLWIGPDLRPRPLAAARELPWTLAGFALSLALALSFGLRPTHHGFHADVESLSQHLLGTRVTEHFVIHYAPNSATARDLEMVAAEHEFAWHRLERLLGEAPPAPVHSFVFPSPEAKRALIGAGNTEVAPPWRGHIYLNEQPFPHRVMHHELAHAFSYNFGDPVFGASARLGLDGLRFNLALIEGFATALAPRSEGALDLHDQAAILERLGLRPELAEIMGLGFWGKASRRAYTAAGSFCLWLLETRGTPAFAALYRSAGDFEAAYGASLAALERDWLAFLAARPLRPQDIEAQRQRFKQRAIFQRPCAHRAAELVAEANLAQARGDAPKRIGALQSLCAVEPEQPEHRLALALAQAQSGMLADADATLAALDGFADLTDTVLALQDERRGDLALARGDLAVADAVYGRALTRGLNEAHQRQLQLKREGAGDPALARQLLAYFDPFEPNPEHPHEAVIRLHVALQIAGTPGRAALGAYLVGRQLLNVGQGAAALVHLERAMAPGPGEPALPGPELRRGAGLMLLEAAVRARSYDRARAVLADLERDPALGPGHRLDLAQWKERLAFFERLLPAAG